MKRLAGVILILIFSCFSMACAKNLGEDFKMVAKILNISDKIEVEVIESDVADGIYWVIVSDKTKYFDLEEKKIFKEDLKAGDIIEIYFGGQVMMSYPPQIVAGKIIKK